MIESFVQSVIHFEQYLLSATWFRYVSTRHQLELAQRWAEPYSGSEDTHTLMQA